MSFDKLSAHYDSSVANGRFDYGHVIERLLEHAEEDPAFVADLAAAGMRPSGTFYFDALLTRPVEDTTHTEFVCRPVGR